MKRFLYRLRASSPEGGPTAVVQHPKRYTERYLARLMRKALREVGARLSAELDGHDIWVESAFEGAVDILCAENGFARVEYAETVTFGAWDTCAPKWERF